MNDTILQELTPSQREAVTHRDGPMLVVAGAGSGKTRVVTRRIAYLIEKGVWPSQILAMTFTNKAAKEMRERIATLIHSEPPRNIGTFHGCCARFLRTEIERLQDGRTKDFTIYDTSEQQAVMKQALKDANLTLPDGLSHKSMCEIVSQAKGARLPVFQVAKDAGYSNPDVLEHAAELYEQRLKQCNAVDFDDLLLLMATVLERFPAVRDVYHNRFRYVLIDEYQDTNHLQYELMKLLVNPMNNIHVTGDPDQSIYSWRGADYSNIMNFEQDYPGAKIVLLEQNYRSTQSILDAANELIAHNEHRMEKNLFTDNEYGVPIRDVCTYSDLQEAEWLAKRIMQLHSNGEAYRDMAVFYRTNSQSRSLEDALIQLSIPYQLLGGVRFYERMEVKDLLAFLRLRVNHCDLVALERVTKILGMGIGPKTLANIAVKANDHQIPVLDFLAHDDFPTLYGKPNAKLKAFAEWARQLLALPIAPVRDAVADILEFSGLLNQYQKEVNAEERKENLKELVIKSAQFEDDHPDATLEDYLAEVSLVADVDAHDTEADYVTLMTLHSSKGLEFPYVFITGVENGYLPHANSMDDPSAREEERRLFYVGITRAQRELTLLHATMRRMWNEFQLREPSDFIAELPNDALKRITYGMRSSRW